MESTGEADKIHCTQATANLLINTGKGSWLEPRGEIVEAKGKGVLKTYWVTPRTHTSSAGSRTSRSDCREETTTTSSVLPARMDSFDVDVATHKALVSLSPQRQRLVGWLVELLSQQLKNIVAHRNKVHIAENEQGSVVSKKCGVDENAILQREGSECPRDEYAESIPMPKFDLNIAGHYGEIDPEKIVLGQKVEEQVRLRCFVANSLHSVHSEIFCSSLLFSCWPYSIPKSSEITSQSSLAPTVTTPFTISTMRGMLQ